MKRYTFNVVCSFAMQFTFSESEVQPDSEGSESDVEPSELALEKLEAELNDFLSQHYGVTKVEAYADSDALLGIEDDPICKEQT